MKRKLFASVPTLTKAGGEHSLVGNRDSLLFINYVRKTACVCKIDQSETRQSTFIAFDNPSMPTSQISKG